MYHLRVRAVAAEILGALLPVGIDAPAMGRAEHLHTTVRQQQLDVEIPAVAAEMLIEWYGVRIEIRENEAVVVHDMRSRVHAPLREIQLAIALRPDGHADEFAGVPIGPSVVRAGELGCVA